MGLITWLKRELEHRRDLKQIDQRFPMAERAAGTPIDEWPPWKQFPNSEPPVRANQGNEEAYWHYDWMPFWNSLTKEQQTDYLTSHETPEAWSEWIKPGGRWERMTGRKQYKGASVVRRKQ